MELSIQENGRPAGRLCVSARGLYTLFEARVEGEGGGAFSRLWLAGEKGESASLGLLEPRRGLRVLRRSFSRLELRSLPSPIRSAFVLPAEERPERGGESGAEPLPAEGAGEERQDWIRLADGSLWSPGGRLLAMPWGGGPFPAQARKMRLEGRDYWLFRT